MIREDRFLISHKPFAIDLSLANHPAIPDGYDGWWRF